MRSVWVVLYEELGGGGCTLCDWCCLELRAAATAAARAAVLEADVDRERCDEVIGLWAKFKNCE